MEDKLLFASKDGRRPNVARLSLEYKTGSGEFICDNLDEWADKASFVVYETDQTGNPISGTETDWIGKISNNKITELKITSGEDRDYQAGTVLMACETAGGRNMLIEALRNGLNPDGTLKLSENNLNFPDNSISGKAVRAGELEFPKGSIPMSALNGQDEDSSLSKAYTDAEIAKLAKVAKTGSYNDLEDKPTPKEKRAARIIIGNSVAGYTGNDVDYLCDGTNDADKIMEAINALPENGGEIKILDGVFNITKPIKIENKNNVRLNGSGRATQLKRKWDSTAPEGVVEIKNSPNTSIVNLYIDENKTEFPSENNKGINSDDTSSETLNTGENGGSGDFLLDKGEKEVHAYIKEHIPDSNKYTSIVSDEYIFRDTGKTMTVGLTAGAGIDFVFDGSFIKVAKAAEEKFGKDGGTILFKAGKYNANYQNFLNDTDSLSFNNLCLKAVPGELVEVSSLYLYRVNVLIENMVFLTFLSASMSNVTMVNCKNMSSIRFDSCENVILKNSNVKDCTIDGAANVKAEKCVFNGTLFVRSSSVYKYVYNTKKSFMIKKSHFTGRHAINIYGEIAPCYERINIEENFFDGEIYNSEDYSYVMHGVSNGNARYGDNASVILIGSNGFAGSNRRNHPIDVVVKNNKFDLYQTAAISVWVECQVLLTENTIIEKTPRTGAVGRFYHCAVFLEKNYIRTKLSFRADWCSLYVKNNTILLTDSSTQFISEDMYNVIFYKNYIGSVAESSLYISASFMSMNNYISSAVFVKNIFYQTRADVSYTKNLVSVIFFKNSFILGYAPESKKQWLSSTLAGGKLVARHNMCNTGINPVNAVNALLDSNVSAISSPEKIIASTSQIDFEDFSQLNIDHFGDLKNALINGTAKRDFPIGSSLPVVKTGSDNKKTIYMFFTVTHYGKFTLSDGSEKNGVILASFSNNLEQKTFDAKEPENKDSYYSLYGNSLYSLSNIHQWLNSDKPSNNWYHPTHQYDTPPPANELESDGFLYGLPKNLLKNIANITLETTVAEGKIDKTTGKFFLPSAQNIGSGDLPQILFSGADDDGGVWDLFNAKYNSSAENRLRCLTRFGSSNTTWTQADIVTRTISRKNKSGVVCTRSYRIDVYDGSTSSNMKKNSTNDYGLVYPYGLSNITPCCVITE